MGESVAIPTAAGLILLLAGRRLFWLSVGVVGFVAAVQVVPFLIAAQPDWVVLLVALGVGIAGALLAILLQWLVAGAAGFMFGGMAVLALQRSAGWEESWLLVFLGAVVGAALVMVLFDWALIFLSSLGGAVLLLQPWPLAPMISMPLLLVLAIAGIAFQAAFLRGEKAPRSIE